MSVNIDMCPAPRNKQQQQQLAELLGKDEEPETGSRRRSSRKREDKSYVECPDIVIEEDYLSKPSPAKKANLSMGVLDMPAKKTRGGIGAKEGVGGREQEGREVAVGATVGGAQTNGIQMESDEEEEGDDMFPPVPLPQVRRVQWRVPRPIDWWKPLDADSCLAGNERRGARRKIRSGEKTEK
jgi:hypothetical protein